MSAKKPLLPVPEQDFSDLIPKATVITAFISLAAATLIGASIYASKPQPQVGTI